MPSRPLFGLCGVAAIYCQALKNPVVLILDPAVVIPVPVVVIPDPTVLIHDPVVVVSDPVVLIPNRAYLVVILICLLIRQARPAFQEKVWL